MDTTGWLGYSAHGKEVVKGSSNGVLSEAIPRGVTEWEYLRSKGTGGSISTIREKE
jgi:hypothetical protein